MTTVLHHEGDDVRLPTRMVIAPETGTFVPLPPDVVTTEGEIVAPGSCLGTVESLGRRVDVTSSFHGFLMGVLALPGERVRAGQPIAWLHALGTEG